MPIEQELNDVLKQAMRDKDQATLDVVRMVKSKIQERRTAKGFQGEVNDELLVDVIGSYRKQLQKAAEEFGRVGDKGVAQVERLQFEIRFCERFLPKRMADDQLRAMVAERITALKVADRRQIGRLVGEILKTHKGQVDAADIKRVAEELLPES